MESSPFKQKVIDLIRLIPQGKVASYGQIALYAGLPRAAREVGWVLNGTEGKVDLPWWRVTNNTGYLSIRGTVVSDKELQRKLLRAESVEVREDFTFDIEKYRWVMPEKEVRKLQLSPEYIEKIIQKYGI